MWQLIRLTFLRWCRQKQRAVDRLAQTHGCRNVAPQVSDNYLFIYDGAILSNNSAVSRQCQTNHAVCEANSWSNLEENERSMRSVGNRDHNRRMRVGIVCHDGSYRYWEWDGFKVCLNPLVLSN